MKEERRFGFSAVFDPIVYIQETGLLKLEPELELELEPEPEAHENTLEQMGAAAKVVLFIDDHDICAEGARAIGVNAIVHRDNPSTIDAIEKFLRELG